jgi:Icc-related predicted phosphoesterase
VLVVPGNHDRTKLASSERFFNIHLRKLELDGLVFVGYGWMGSDLDPERQMDRFHEVEPWIDHNTVLVTHCPPFGTLDVMKDLNGTRYRIGSGKLAKAIDRLKPRFHLFGHIHDSVGAKGTSVNGSYPKIKHFFGIDTETKRVWAEIEK